MYVEDSLSLPVWWQERDERKEREKQEFLRSVVGLWPPDTIETLARHMTHLTVDALTVGLRLSSIHRVLFIVIYILIYI